MFRLRCITRNIWRRKRQNSILVASIAVLALLFVVSYAFKAGNAEKIRSFYEHFQVTAAIVQNEDMVDYAENNWLAKAQAEKITKYSDFIEAYNYIKDEAIYVYPSKEAANSFFDTLTARETDKNSLLPEDFGIDEAMAYGRTNLALDMDLSDVAIQFAEGYDESHFNGELDADNIVMINKRFADARDIQIGDAMLIGEAFSYTIATRDLFLAEKLALKEYYVVGIFDAPEQNKTVYMPLIKTVEMNTYAKHYRLDINYDGADYILKQTDRLAEFKQQLLDEKAVANEIRFIIYDDAMTQVLEPLLSANRFISMGINFLYVVVVLIGFILSFILLKTRVHEIALDISIGVRYFYIFLVLFVEFFILCLGGLLVGVAVGLLVTAQPLYGTALVFFMAAFAAGTALSILSTLRLKPIATLTKRD